MPTNPLLAALAPGESSTVDLLPGDAPAYARRLVDVVSAATPKLLSMSDADSRRHPAPGKWSACEIVGHLVDSASNNHQRFVRMAARDDLVVDGYAQDEWVARQRYQDAPWSELVLLWQLYNRHLARVMSVTSPADRQRSRAVHNLHERGFGGLSRDEPVTLELLMANFVDHLEHHLAQVHW